MSKINLEDLSTFSANEKISLIEYNTISSRMIKVDINTTIIEVLMTIREKPVVIKNILSKEFESLSDSKLKDKEGKKTVLLYRLNEFFSGNANNLNSIIIFSSLIGLPEQKASDYFEKDLSLLSDLLESQIGEFIENFKSLTEEDESFDVINKNVCVLSDISSRLKKCAFTNGKKIAFSFFKNLSIDDQMDFMARYYKHVGLNDNLQIANNQISKRNDSTDAEQIEDIEILEEKINSSNPNDKNSQEDLMEGFKEIIIPIFKKTDTKIKVLEQKNIELEKSLKHSYEMQKKTFELLESYISKQNGISKTIAKKYNIKFDSGE